MTTTTKLITAEEFLRLPRGNGKRYELIRGVLIEKMGTGHPHSILVSMIAHILLSYVIPNDYGTVHTGEPGYLLDLDPDTVRCPDVAWIAPGRVPEGTRGFPNLAPDLAVEVKSPSNSNPEMASKAWMWLSYGSRQAWVTDPERNTLTVYRHGSDPQVLAEDDELTGGDLLPGFTTPVWRLFRRER